MMEITRRHWCAALFVAVLLHAAMAAAALWQAPESGAASTGAGGIEVSLGPAGGAPGSTVAEVTEAEEAETAEPVETAKEPLPETITAVERQPAPTEPTEIESAEPAETAVERQPTENVEAVEPPESRAAETAEPEIQKAETAEVQEAEAVEIKTAEASEPMEAAEAAKPLPPLPQARPNDLPKKVVQKQPTPEPQAPEETKQTEPRAEQTAAEPPSTAGTAGKSGTGDSAEAGSSSASSGGGNPGQVADYMARLQAWLERHKEYPRHAKQRRQEGTVMLYVVMDREGRVLEHRLKQSSGYDLLDRAVQEMIERAQPLPEIPPEMTQARLELIVPVQFFLR